jgi:enamine deaminase RidA (YjgF/YER057c/UK114 family)
MTPEEKLRQMGIELPAVAAPVANYVPYKRAGDCLYISGQLPSAKGEVLYKGKVGAQVTVDQARAAARLCAINILAAAKAAVGDLSTVEVLRVEGFVASAEGFTAQPAVINGASDFLVEVLGQAGRHARFAVGVSELPLGGCVEIAAILKVS